MSKSTVEGGVQAIAAMVNPVSQPHPQLRQKFLPQRRYSLSSRCISPDMREPDKKNIIKLEPGTLVLIIAGLILLPLLLTGFLAQ